MIKNILFIILLSGILFFPNGGILDDSTLISSILILISCFLGRFKNKKCLQDILYLLPLIALSFYSLLVIYINQSYDFYYFLNFSRVIIISLGIYSLIRIFNLGVFQNLSNIYIALYVNVLITLVQYYDWFGLAQFAFSINKQFISYAFREYRVMGLLSGYDSNGITLAFTLVLGTILFFISKNIYIKIIFLVLNFGCLIGLLFASRTGIVAAIIGTAIIFIVINWKNYLKLIVALVGILVFVVVLYKSVITFEQFVPQKYQQTYEFMFEPILNYYHYGKFESISTDDLVKNHYTKLSDDNFIVMFGSSFSNASKLGGYTDVGYLQIINGLGLIGLLLVLICFGYWTFLIFKVKRQYFPSVDESTRLPYKYILAYLIAFVINIFILNFKGPYFYADTIIFIFMTVFLTYFYEIRIMQE
ncbi:oligosaccharide repeat unit polymerase [Bacillus sp. EB106-08-02-XG196]|uniref:oligosaccharide repeat unit polymerase n=1 Tax=Bacillus sp. EB106-08-02-XG196 TaxID=2737049 RepID=UPI0015C478B7|nr:oligosaccharide repeat unit polymerase [Bacillus sp. EB106-08-02-XG196]NWQ41103.1 oligosaccharide repeat unit polymerase [Bacillus sp. EB106-08-02-XG196]